MSTSFLQSSRTLTIAAALAAVSACSSDPSLSNLVTLQGPEDPGIPQGQYHRAGQACLACHNSKGPGVEFSVAGTVFLKPADAKNRTLVGVDNVDILLIDGAGVTKVLKTNCVGNFFVTKKDLVNGFNPKYPMKVAVAHPQFGVSPMASTVGRDGSCAGCHRYDRAIDSVGNIFVTADPNAAYTPTAGCAVDPPTVQLDPLGANP